MARKQLGANTSGASDAVSVNGAQNLTNKTLTSPKIDTIKDSNGASSVGIGSATTAVNFLALNNSSTGNAPGISAAGSDTNSHVNIVPKGTGGLQIYTPTGQSAKLQAGGVDTDVTLSLLSKGVGTITANGNPVLSSVTSVPAATGTPSGSTYLRGDGTWATPPGGAGDPTATPSTIAQRDAQANLLADAFIPSQTSTATSGITTTLTVDSNQTQLFTGSANQTLVLPTTSIVAGQFYTLINSSSGQITVNASGGATVGTLSPTGTMTVTAAQATPTLATHWNWTYAAIYAPSTSSFTNTVTLRNAQANINADAFIPGSTSTVSSGTTLTITVDSTEVQVITGSSTQLIQLPTTTIVAGQRYTIVNTSTGAATVQSSGANTINVMAASTTATFTALVSTPTTAANWGTSYVAVGGDASTNTATSVDGEVALFNGTTGKSLKRANAFSGIATLASGVLSATSTTGSGNVVLATSPAITTPTGIVKGDVGLGNVDNTSDVNKPVSTAQQTALNLKANLASPTFTGTAAFTNATVSATPSGANDVANKSYVDAGAQGLSAKTSVAAVATSNISLSAPQTIDGISVVAGNRVLAQNQTTTSQNGIWVVAAGAWTRPTDFASASTQIGTYVFVEGGTTNASSGWVMSGTSNVTVDTNPETWVQFSGAGEISVDSTLTKSGNQLSRAALTGDITASTGSNATVLKNTGPGATGPIGSATISPSVTIDAQGRVTALTSNTIAVAIGSVSGLGTGVATALGNNVGSAGAPVVNGGALGTPSSGTATNLTGTAAGLTAGTVTTNANLTGDVTSTGNATTIAATAVSLSKMANLTANSVIANTTGSAATPTATPVNTTPGVSTVAMWDASKNLSANSHIGAIRTQATTGGTLNLSVSDAQYQQFTGTTTQTVVLPAANTLTVGQSFVIMNRSSLAIIVNMNGGTALQAMSAGSQLTATVVNNSTAPGTWDAAFTLTNTVGLVSTNGSALTTTGATNNGKFIPFLQIGFVAQGDAVNATFTMTSNTDSSLAQLEIFGQQTAAMNNDPAVSLKMMYGNSINMDSSQFTAVVTSKTISLTIVTLYAQVNRTNEIWYFHLTSADYTGGGGLSGLVAQSYVGSLPVGTQFLGTSAKTSKYSILIGDGVTTAIAVTHNLGTQDCTFSIRDATTNAYVDCDVVSTSTTVMTFTFATAPASNAYKVVVIG